MGPTPRRYHSLGLALMFLGIGIVPGLGDQSSQCRPGDRGRLLQVVRVASRATATDVRDYFETWVDFYRDFYGFTSFPVDIDHGVDTYKVTYCTIDAVLLGQSNAAPIIATGNVSVPRKSGPLSTVVYLHGTSVSFYDAPSNPNVFGEFNENGESFDGPPSSAIFAGGGFIYIAPDYVGLGDSTVPRHRYFHAATEASSAVDLLAASRHVLARLQVQRSGQLFVFGFSQGGHAALALHRALQNQRVDVTATATVGGVLDIERFFLLGLSNETTVTIPLYVSYILLGVRRHLRRVRRTVRRLQTAIRRHRTWLVRHAALLRRRARRAAAHRTCAPSAVLLRGRDQRPGESSPRSSAPERSRSLASERADPGVSQPGRRRSFLRSRVSVGRTAAGPGC